MVAAAGSASFLRILHFKAIGSAARRDRAGGNGMLQKLADKALSLLIPHTQAAATYTETYYNRVQGGPGDGCQAYGYRWRQVRTCTYMDSGKLIDCTNWAYYACGW
jgi:hypothetical protein